MNTNSISDKESGFSSKMALCLAAITIVGIDGEFKDQELERLRILVQDSEVAFLKAFEFYNSRSLETCIQVIAVKLTDIQKRAAYTILHTLAHADGTIAQSEEKLLQQYAQKFGFTEKTLSDILQLPSNANNLTLFD